MIADTGCAGVLFWTVEMAQEWIKVEKATARKPEVLRISSALGIHPDHAFGLCVRFWCWCDDQCDNCHAAGVTLVTLDLILGHTGFATQLVQAGWLIESDDGIEIPNFEYHLSKSAKTRAQSAMRQQKSRSKRDIRHGESVTEAWPEKRREEKIEQTQDANASGGGGSAPKKRTRAAFQKPALAEITAYIQEIGATIDGSEWFDHYEANGWKVGRNAMKDWKATVRGWESRRKASGNGAKSTNGHTNDAWDRVCAGFKKHDLECDRAALEAFIGPELWKAVRAVGPRNIMEMTTFTKSAVQKEFEAALRGGT